MKKFLLIVLCIGLLGLLAWFNYELFGIWGLLFL